MLRSCARHPDKRKTCLNQLTQLTHEVIQCHIPEEGLSCITDYCKLLCLSFLKLSGFHKYRLPETNIAPARKTSPKESSVPDIHFQVLCKSQGGYKIIYIYIYIYVCMYT